MSLFRRPTGTVTITTLNFGDPTVDGSWRIIVDGNNLVQQRRESGVWVEKTAATP